jgi:hypothetical protein
MSCCFYRCHHSGELIFKSKTNVDWQKIIKHSSLHFSPGFIGYRLPYHKTDPFYWGTDILFSSQIVADPILLLQEYVQAQDAIHSIHRALFLQEDNSHPTCSWFDSKIFSFVDSSFGGHSPHTGGATFYVNLDLFESIIMALGRWSSTAWKIYVHDNPCICVALQLAALHCQ